MAVSMKAISVLAGSPVTHLAISLRTAECTMLLSSDSFDGSENTIEDSALRFIEPSSDIIDACILCLMPFFISWLAIVDRISHCRQYVAYNGFASSDSSGNNYDIWTASAFR